MIEKEVILDGIDMRDFLGINNANLDFLSSFYPKIKIIARGNTIKAYGEKVELNSFWEVLELLIDCARHHRKLSPHIIEQLATDQKITIEGDVLCYDRLGKPIKARTHNQQKLIEATLAKDLVFAIGPAGTGKTYTAIALAVKALKQNQVRKIILSRPAVEAGERLGFLPGDMKEKIDPYLQPLYDALLDMMPNRRLEELIAEKTIEIAPLAFMRGRTLSNSFVILDEAQNTTENQIKMFLTRMGQNTKYIITGDTTQVDLERHQKSGLIHALKVLKEVDDIGVITFDEQDIMRHNLVRKIVHAYQLFDQIHRPIPPHCHHDPPHHSHHLDPHHHN